MPQRGRFPASTARSGRTVPLLIAVALVAAGCAALAAGGAAKDHAILAAVQRFLLFYSGVFALIALTAAVAAGLVATDRVVMRAGGRVISQALHRAISLAAVGFLVIHIVTEILAHRSRAVDAVVPFLASGRTLYIGLGTVASDLLLLILVTGIARRRFAAAWPGLWRAVHATAYLCWPLGVVHGLMAGRAAKPYVDWSYGACLALAGLMLVVRFTASTRSREEVTAHPVPDQPGQAAARLAAAAALTPASAGPPGAAMPSAAIPRALPAGPAAAWPPGSRPQPAAAPVAGPPRSAATTSAAARNQPSATAAASRPADSPARGGRGGWPETTGPSSLPPEPGLPEMSPEETTQPQPVLSQTGPPPAMPPQTVQPGTGLPGYGEPEYGEPEYGEPGLEPGWPEPLGTNLPEMGLPEMELPEMEPPDMEPPELGGPGPAWSKAGPPGAGLDPVEPSPGEPPGLPFTWVVGSYPPDAWPPDAWPPDAWPPDAWPPGDRYHQADEYGSYEGPYGQTGPYDQAGPHDQAPWPARPPHLVRGHGLIQDSEYLTPDSYDPEQP